MGQAMTRVISTNLRRIGGAKATRGVLYFPKSLVDDSTFPFLLGEKVLVRIRGKRIIIEKDARRPRTEAVSEPTKTKTSRRTASSKA